MEQFIHVLFQGLLFLFFIIMSYDLEIYFSMQFQFFVNIGFRFDTRKHHSH